MAHERARLGKLAPDARQEQGAALARAENETVAIGLERAREFRFAYRRNRPRVGKDRDVEPEPGKLGLLKRAKTRIGEARLRRIGDCVVEQRPPRRRRTDAASQLSVLGQGDESR